jgi:hypothetical protein
MASQRTVGKVTVAAKVHRHRCAAPVRAHIEALCDRQGAVGVTAPGKCTTVGAQLFNIIAHYRAKRTRRDYNVYYVT